MPDLSIFRNRTPAVTGEHSVRNSAVMIPVMETPEGLHLLFEVRSEKLEHQPGDICFPGGGIEEGETPEEAALRELTERCLTERDSATDWILIVPGRSEEIESCLRRIEERSGGFAVALFGEDWMLAESEGEEGSIWKLRPAS